MFLRTIFTGVTACGGAAAAWSYANLPVFAAAPIAESTSLGMLAGAFFGTAVYCVSGKAEHLGEGVRMLGVAFGGMGGLFTGIGAVADSSRSFQKPMQDSAYVQIFDQYGKDLKRLEEGHRVPFNVDLGRGMILPMMAVALEDPQYSVRSLSDGGEVYVSACADFVLSHNPPAGEDVSNIAIEDAEVEMCYTRNLTSDEWSRILAPTN